MVNIANIATARHFYSTDIMKIPQGGWWVGWGRELVLGGLGWEGVCVCVGGWGGWVGGGHAGYGGACWHCLHCSPNLLTNNEPVAGLLGITSGGQSADRSPLAPPCRRPGQRLCLGLCWAHRHQLPRHPRRLGSAGACSGMLTWQRHADLAAARTGHAAPGAAACRSAGAQRGHHPGLPQRCSVRDRSRGAHPVTAGVPD